MKAQFRTVCADGCDEMINPGDEIVSSSEGWMHERCPGSPDPVKANGALCSRCFTYHRGECL